jgi:hypothetical protein
MLRDPHAAIAVPGGGGAVMQNSSPGFDRPRPTYPNAPGFKERGGASEAAAKAVSRHAKNLRARVLDIIGRVPGRTADEYAVLLDCSILSVRPRVSELRRSGEIVPADTRKRNNGGMTASTWRLAPPLPNDRERA